MKNQELTVLHHHGRGYGEESFEITPFSSTSFLHVLEKFGIKLPNIVDRSMGVSKCCECGAVYAGNQPRCDLEIEWHRPSGAWHDRRGHSLTEKTFKKKCEGRLNWNLDKEFTTQQEFFSLLNKIACLPDIQYDPLHKFESHFPPGVAEHLRVALIQQDTETLKVQMNQVGYALKEIASRMNSAGQCLSFNGF